MTLLDLSLANSTKKAYNHHWNTFTKFLLNDLNQNTISMPVRAMDVALFISHLFLQGLMYSTIRSYVSAISFVHKIKGHEDPGCAFLVNKILRGVQKARYNKKQPLKPIDKALLYSLVNTLPFIADSKFNMILYKALFLITFYACLRAGEIVISNTNKHTICINQLRTTKTDAGFGYQIILNSYKHSGTNCPKINIQPNGSDQCPVSALSKYLALRPNKSGPIFIDITGQPINRKQFSDTLKNCLAFREIPANHYNTHSFRIGRATQMASDEYSDPFIKSVGRWKSAAFKKYIRPNHIDMPN